MINRRALTGSGSSDDAGQEGTEEDVKKSVAQLLTLEVISTLAPELRPEAGARQLDRDKARCTMHVSSSPPLRTRRATFTAPGSTPVVLLQGQHPEAFLRISPAYTDFTVDSLRVRWIPLLQSFHRLGAFAMGTHPRVHGFPVRRLLCPIRLSPGASSIRETFPSHYFPTALTIPRGVSRVPHGRLTWNEGGGVFLSLPLPRFAAPQALDRG